MKKKYLAVVVLLAVVMFQVYRLAGSQAGNDVAQACAQAQADYAGSVRLAYAKIPRTDSMQSAMLDKQMQADLAKNVCAERPDTSRYADQVVAAGGESLSRVFTLKYWVRRFLR